MFFAWLLNPPLVFAKLLFIDCSTVFVKLKPRILISVWSDMFRALGIVLHPTTVNTFDFFVFTRAPVAFT